MGPVRSPIMPASSAGSQCTVRAAPTGLSTLASITSRAPPGMVSSAGWNTSLTVPGSGVSRAYSTSIRPAPSATVVCTSWPQAWHTPGTVDAYGTSLTSASGSASRSPRTMTTGAVGAAGDFPSGPMSQYSPTPSGSSCGSSPAAPSRVATASVVRCSARPSSGCAWRSRRKATSSGSLRASQVSAEFTPSASAED
jgi:hypothetical protein